MMGPFLLFFKLKRLVIQTLGQKAYTRGSL